jgi:hypothetical protein
MSFAVPSQRGFQQAQSDIPTIPTHHNQQPTRMNIQPSQQYDQYHSSHNPFPASPLSAPPLQNGAQAAFPHDQTSQQLPKVGETRCCKSLSSCSSATITLRSSSYLIGSSARKTVQAPYSPNSCFLLRLGSPHRGPPFHLHGSGPIPSSRGAG